MQAQSAEPVASSPLQDLLRRRRTSRRFSAGPMSSEQLSRLLRAALGPVGDGRRSVPSAHARYPLSLAVVVGGVDGLPAGVYRYDADADAVSRRTAGDRRRDFAAGSFVDEDWLAGAAALVVIGADLGAAARDFADQPPDRGERYVWLEAGHLSQNLYLQAAEEELGAALVAGVDDERLREAAHDALPEGHLPLALFAVGPATDR
ncbi:SagB/ThcOx family dehydrogenase [Occultella glacieicola]|uniref:SagB/ThcOx family dehydrogenase n=2 Tax=Occultella glacieicola TaxID=2518684 RepID=A0ABY2E5A5_9MICO|nr:SagB/ThcOx family dehydrogenase [Occultella glacieicola]